MSDDVNRSLAQPQITAEQQFPARTLAALAQASSQSAATAFSSLAVPKQVPATAEMLPPAAQAEPATAPAQPVAAVTAPAVHPRPAALPTAKPESASTDPESSLQQQTAATPASMNASSNGGQAGQAVSAGTAAPVANGNAAGQAIAPAAGALPSSATDNQAPGQNGSNGLVEDPWNALDVQWDSDTPPGWPRLVCPWQVMEDRGGELRKAKERYRQAEAEKREKAKQEALIRDANRRAAAERSQQAAAAMQAERMRRTLEARAVVAQVAEQKEAGRAAMAAAQGTNGAQLLAGVVPQPNSALAMASLARTVTPGNQAATPYSQQLSQLQGLAAGQQLQQAQLASQQKLALPAGALQPVLQSNPHMQYQPSYDYTQAYRQSQLSGNNSTHAGQTAADPTQGNAMLQVQAALAAPVKASSKAQLPMSQNESAPGLSQAVAAVSGEAPVQQQAAMGGGNPSGEGQSPDGTQGSSPGQTECSGTKRGRSADGDEQSSPPRAKKAKPAAEGYRERWLAGKPRAHSKTWCSMLCSVCEQAGDESELLVCKGPCLRAFHPACLRLPQESNTSLADQANWFCPECLYGRVRCFVCGEFGAGFEDPTVRKCSLGVCGRFYHIKCAQSLELTQMAKKGAHFRCPQHYCAVCRKSGDGVDMVKCIRCPTAYHSSCMPKDIQRLMPHAKVVLCGKHAGQEPGQYQAPPAPDPTKLEAAQQQGRAMGLPPIKAKANHGAGGGLALPSADQTQAGQPDEDLQEVPPVGHAAADSIQTGFLSSALTGDAAATDAQQPGLHPHYNPMPADFQANAVTPSAPSAHNPQQ